MDLLPVNCWRRGPSFFTGSRGDFSIHLYRTQKSVLLPTTLHSGYNIIFPRAFSSKKSVKKLIKREYKKPPEIVSKDFPFMEDNILQNDDDGLVKTNPVTIPSRDSVLQACTITSGLIAAFGIIIRQASHFAAGEGLPVLDCTSEVSFGFEKWHLELIIGSVALISSCRYLLLKIWPDFSKSSEVANKQVLTSLQPLDYIVIAFLPGFSEELLFRGALVPLFGFDWKSVLVGAAIFGVLHISGGRKYSFAIWATFVGIVYGYATISSSSLVVPMASHTLNNLAGGILWHYESNSLDKQQL